MLPKKDNEILTRVGPGTPMGEMLREYWWPVLRSVRLESGGAPLRVRLLSEDYVAFRSPNGEVGVVSERCPHRGVSMMLARNEECGLRCVLHGWLVTAKGEVLETPNEKEAGSRLSRLKTRHLPVHEAGGLIWVWAGTGAAPVFPNYPFTEAKSAMPMLGYMRCNWFQVMETLWDPSHVGILHGQGNDAAFADLVKDLDVGQGNKSAPLYTAGAELRDEPFGFSYRFTEGQCSGSGIPAWVPTVLPGWVHITTFNENPWGDRAVIGHVPIDDENMFLVQITYNRDGPIGMAGDRTQMGDIDPDNFVPTTSHRENNWGQDREAIKNGSFTGIGAGLFAAGLLMQDQAALESIGPIADRSVELIGPSDHAIVKGRTVFLEAVRAHQNGAKALGAFEDLSQVGE